jgi:hypothetical protein
VAAFPLIVLLINAAGDQLHAVGDNVWTGVSNQKVNIVARHDVIKYRKTEALFSFENPAEITLPIAPQWSLQNRPLKVTSKPAINRKRPRQVVLAFYLLVRQARFSSPAARTAF